jgi:rubrerythrin
MTNNEQEEQIKELEERLEALVIAIPKEESAYHFYLNIAGKIKNDGTRRMFLELAEQELMHKKRLEGFVDDINKKLAQLKADKKKEQSKGWCGLIW